MICWVHVCKTQPLGFLRSHVVTRQLIDVWLGGLRVDTLACHCQAAAGLWGRMHRQGALLSMFGCCAVMMPDYAVLWCAVAQVDKIVGRGAPAEFILQLESLANSHHQDMGLDCMRAYHFGARCVPYVR